MPDDKWTDDQDFQMGTVKVGGDAIKVEEKEDDNKQKSARDGYMDIYDSKDQEYKDRIVTHATCLEFETFPIQGLPAKPTGLGA
jgi:hypothetical protein